MKTMFSAKAILVLATTVALATVSIVAQTPGEQKSLTGVVSDAMCGHTHMMKDKPDADCLRYCVKQGNNYAIVVGKTVHPRRPRSRAGSVSGTEGHPESHYAG